MIDYGRFAERLKAATSRWDLLREFQGEWGYQVPEEVRPWPRWSEPEHKAYVRGLAGEDDRFAGVDRALPIPKALDEWWDLPFNSFTHSPRLYWTSPEWPPTVRPDPSGYGVGEALEEGNPFVEPEDDHRVCVFMAEYQYCNEWGYLAAEAGQDDPRVLVGGSKDDTGHSWRMQSRSISEFFLQLAMHRLSTNLGWSVEANRDDFEHPPSVFPELGLLPWGELAADAMAYGAPDAIVWHSRGGYVDWSIVIGARSRKALVGVLETLGARPGLYVAPPEGPLGKFALDEGDADDRGCWRVLGRRVVEPFPFDVPPKITAAAYDGDLLAAGDANGRVHVAMAPDKVLYQAEPHEAPVTAIDCRRTDGVPLVVSGDEKGVVRCGTDVIAHRSGKVTAVGVGLLETGPTVAIAWADGSLEFVDLESGAAEQFGFGHGIERIEWEADELPVIISDHRAVALELDVERLWPHRELLLRLKKTEWADEELPRLIEKAAKDEWYSASRLQRVPLEPTAAPFLAGIVAERTSEHREMVVQALARLVPTAPEAVRVEARRLVPLLDDPDVVVRRTIPYLLSCTGPEFVPTLQERFRDEDDPGAAASLVLAVGRISGQALGWFEEVIAGAPSAEVRAAAIVAMIECGAEEVPDRHLTALNEQVEAQESALDDLPWAAEGRETLLTGALNGRTAMRARPETRSEPMPEGSQRRDVSGDSRPDVSPTSPVSPNYA